MSRSLNQSGSLQVPAEMKDTIGKRLDGLTVAEAGAGIAYVSGAAAGTRRVSSQLSSTSVTNAAIALDLTQRTVERLNVTTTRWRLKFGNNKILDNTTPTTPATVTGVAIGTPEYKTTGTFAYRPNGNSTVAMTNLATGSITVPTDGSYSYSPWFTSPSQQFAPGVPKVISLGVTSTATGTGLAYGISVTNFHANGASNFAAQSITGLAGYLQGATSTVPWWLDTLIEYEWIGTQPIIAVVGDSLAEGYSPNGDARNEQAGCLPFEAWPRVMGDAIGAVVCNLGTASGRFDTTFSAAANKAYTRADLTTCRPDAIIWALGANNTGSSIIDNSTAMTQILTSIQAAQTFAPKIFLATVMPRGDLANTADTFNAACAAAATTIVSNTLNPVTGTKLSLGSGGLKEEVTTTGTPTGTGPYTITLTAGTIRAHIAGEVIASANARTRRHQNDFMGNLPLGVHGIIDFDMWARRSATSEFSDPERCCADMLHMLRYGYMGMGHFAATTLGRML